MKLPVKYVKSQEDFEHVEKSERYFLEINGKLA